MNTKNFNTEKVTMWVAVDYNCFGVKYYKGVEEYKGTEEIVNVEELSEAVFFDTKEKAENFMADEGYKFDAEPVTFYKIR